MPKPHAAMNEDAKATLLNTWRSAPRAVSGAVVDPKSGEVLKPLGAQLTEDDTLCLAEAGTIILGDDVTPTTIRNSGSLIDLLESSNAVSTIASTDGTTKLRRDAGTIDLAGGLIQMLHKNITPGTINMRQGTLEYQVAGSSGGVLNGYGGTIDARALSGDVTYSGGALYPGLKIIRPKYGTLDVSACTDYGATFYNS